MSLTSSYFNKTDNISEQNLVQDLIDESIEVNGIPIYYLPKTIVNMDSLFLDDPNLTFNKEYLMSGYVQNAIAFDGGGEFLRKFGLDIEKRTNIIISKRQFERIVQQKKPYEGDLIYIPSMFNYFDIKHVEAENPFYALGTLYQYSLECEVVKYNQEKIETGIQDIDSFSYDNAYSINLIMSNGTGDFQISETVYQGSSLANANAIANVALWNVASKTLKIVNIIGNLTASINIIGNTSAASWNVASFDANTFPNLHDIDNSEIIANAPSILDTTTDPRDFGF